MCLYLHSIALQVLRPHAGSNGSPSSSSGGGEPMSRSHSLVSFGLLCHDFPYNSSLKHARAGPRFCSITETCASLVYKRTARDLGSVRADGFLRTGDV